MKYGRIGTFQTPSQNSTLKVCYDPNSGRTHCGCRFCHQSTRSRLAKSRRGGRSALDSLVFLTIKNLPRGLTFARKRVNQDEEDSRWLLIPYDGSAFTPENLRIFGLDEFHKLNVRTAFSSAEIVYLKVDDAPQESGSGGAFAFGVQCKENWRATL